MFYMYFLTWLVLIFCLSLFLSDLGEELNCLAFDGNTIIVGGGSGILSVWDIFHVKNIGKIPAHQGPITCLWVSENGDYVATGGDDRRVVVWTTTKSWRKNINFRFRNLIFFVKLHKIMKKRKIFREIDPKIMKKNPKILCSVLPTVSQNIGKKFQILVRLRETREIK